MAKDENRDSVITGMDINTQWTIKKLPRITRKQKKKPPPIKKTRMR